MDAALLTRPMSEAEFDRFRTKSIIDYAAAHVTAGNWSADEAHAKATEALDELLPAGAATEGHLVLTAENPHGDAVGSLWILLDRGGSGGAWIYDIVIDPEHRGQGLGRALLAAAEREVTRHGVTSLALNVFGDNHVARHLYETAGYETTTLQMRKALTPDADASPNA